MDRTGAVALRAAFESAVQLGRSDEVNRQAEMANPTKCRDLLQAERPLKIVVAVVLAAPLAGMPKLRSGQEFAGFMQISCMSDLYLTHTASAKVRLNKNSLSKARFCLQLKPSWSKAVEHTHLLRPGLGTHGGKTCQGPQHRRGQG
jgi:hypothetical protein